MRAIMYHYVREYRNNLPFFRFLDFNNFRKQLDYFQKEYGFVSKNDWYKYVGGEGMGKSEGKVVLTFDDAVSCHFDYVFPELEKRGLWGIFYAPTFPYQSNDILDVHKIHILCGLFDGEELNRVLLKLVDEEMVPDKKRKEFRNFTYLKQKNCAGILEFKKSLNYYINYKYRSDVINKIAATFNYTFDSKAYYVSPKNLRKMMNFGHIIGSHTVDHPVMSKLNFNEQLIQIVDSFRYLKGIQCNNDMTYCHPYGGFHSFNRDTLNILNAEQVAYSFNVESRQIRENDIKDSRQHLPRFDCNEFMFGAVS